LENVEWSEIPNDEYMVSTNSRDSYVRVIWEQRFLGDVRARKCTIRSQEQWKSTVENAFLPRYKDGKTWEDPTAQNLTLYEYSLQVPSDVEFTANSILREDKDIKLTSVYHTVLGKRLLVDGVHHAIGLQLMVNRNEQFPEVRVMECYGANVAEMFKADFVHL
jgi:hypothetical protein